MKTWGLQYRNMQAPVLQVPDINTGSSAWLDGLAALMVLALGLYAYAAPAQGVVMVFMLLLWMVALLAQGTAAARRLTALSWVALSSLVIWRSWAQADPALCLAHLADWFSLSLGLAMVYVLAQHLSALQRQSAQQAQALQASFHQITQLATHDELTGLSNRRHMSDLVAHEQLRQARTHAPVCMAMLDLDHFKKINDAFGHAAGDAVLTNFARILRQTLRATDEISRWGGEEFLLLMPHTTLEEAHLAIERLRWSLQKVSMTWVSPIAFSAGIVPMQEGQDMDQVIALADEAMYQAKAQGRNCSVLQSSMGKHASLASRIAGSEKMGA